MSSLSLQLHNLSASTAMASAVSTPMRYQHDPYKHSCFFQPAQQHTTSSSLLMGSSVKSETSSQDDEWNTPPLLSHRTTAPSTPYHRPASGASLMSQPLSELPSSSTATQPVGELMHEAALAGRCDLLITPHSLADNQDPFAEVPIPHGKPSLFLGHMRFETTAAELAWLIRATTGVRVIKCEPRAAGCFVVYLDNDDDVALVRSLHKRLLFDVSGVWYARTKDQVAIMADFIQERLAHKRSRREKVRVPHDALCVETQKTQARRPPLPHHQHLGGVAVPPPFFYGANCGGSPYAMPPAYPSCAAVPFFGGASPYSGY